MPFLVPRIQEEKINHNFIVVDSVRTTFHSSSLIVDIDENINGPPSLHARASDLPSGAKATSTIKINPWSPSLSYLIS